MTIEQTTLYFKEGTSDKIYQTWIDKDTQTEQYQVNFAYGRRGRTLRSGTKTPYAVANHTASRIYNKLVESKLAKGYGYTLPE